jgi:hypothetical protein
MDLEDESSEFDPELMLAQVLENPGVSQILIRHRTATEETLSVHVRCQFAAGQQRFTLHVPFYPHFSSIPEVAASIFDDTGGRTRITDRQKFGTRIEITLDQPAESIQQVLIEVTATASTLVSHQADCPDLPFQPRQFSE